MAEHDWAGVVDHPSGFLALSRSNVLFTRPGVNGFVAYRAHGRYRINLGGVQAAPEQRAALLDEFLAESRREGCRAVAMQVREDQVDLFRARGFAVNQFGSSFGVDLAAFTMAGGARLKLRNRIQRARRAGVRVVELGRDLPASVAAWDGVQRVSQVWLRGKKGPELDFLIGELGRPGDPYRRIFVALDALGEMLGFITYVPAWGVRSGYLHDLTRRVPAAPPGVMELTNAEAMGRFAGEGARFLHFGLTPFVVDPQEPPGGHRGLAWLLRLIGRRGRFLYPALSQREYKMKWAPDAIEREYVAFETLAPGAVWALLSVTRSLPWAPRTRAARGPERPQAESQEAFP